MLIPFFYQLRDGGMKTSITELLTLLEAMRRGVAGHSVDDFYYLARACLVKDESQLDRFDRIFSAYFRGVEDSLADLIKDVPEDWLRREAELYLSDEERARAPKLYETLTWVGNELQNGQRHFEHLESEAADKLREAGFAVDYFAIRRAQNLEQPDRDCDDLVVLTAARLGSARLIDNIVVTI